MQNSEEKAVANTNGVITSAEIRCENVTRQFKEANKPAVDHVSFRVAAGDLVVLLGPSGCGKTTLLKMINRLYELDDGKIWIGEDEIHTLPVNALRRQIGYAIQQVGLFPHMTIRKNIAVVPHLLGWDEARIQQRALELLELVGLPQDYLTRYPRQLSGGEQQRIGLARALAANPAILLMDEPFAAVDAINRDRLQCELLEIHHKLHKTILFVTHDVEEAFRLADKIIIMEAGKLVQYGTPIEIVSNPANKFVEELIDTNNLLRRLSLLSVQSVLDARQAQAARPTKTEDIPAEIRPQQDLRSALTLMLNQGKESVLVKDDAGKELGELTFDDLRIALTNQVKGDQGVNE
jgi:osmoprotectant transport system ATP-binding protein